MNAEREATERIDAALDSVLRAAGSSLKHYTMPKSLEDMRNAMRKIMSDSYIAGSAAFLTLTTETPEQRKARYQVEDMARLIGRLAYRLRKLSPDEPIVKQALDFLVRTGLQGNPLRMDNGGSVIRFRTK